MSNQTVILTIKCHANISSLRKKEHSIVAISYSSEAVILRQTINYIHIHVN